MSRSGLFRLSSEARTHALWHYSQDIAYASVAVNLSPLITNQKRSSCTASMPPSLKSQKCSPPEIEDVQGAVLRKTPKQSLRTIYSFAFISIALQARLMSALIQCPHKTESSLKNPKIFCVVQIIPIVIIIKPSSGPRLQFKLR